MDPNTAELIREVATDALKILGPAIIAAIATYKSIKSQYNIEKLRLHDKDRALAHKQAFLFARRLRNRIFPMASDKVNAFKAVMRDEYFGKLDMELVYFGEDISTILDRLEEGYICLTDPDLIPEMDPDKTKKFLEEELFEMTDQLVKAVRKSMREGGVSA